MKKVIVDTSVWSLALRHRSSSGSGEVARLELLIRERAVMLMGVVRQEILSGIKHQEQFDRLRDQLAAFPDLELKSGDYESAASLYNQCKARGVQASHTDFLIVAAAMNRNFAILTADKDFAHIAKVVPFELI